MKTTTNLRISKKLTKASECFKRVIAGHKKLQTILSILLITFSLSAQSFEKIDGLGKTDLQVIEMTQYMLSIATGVHGTDTFISVYNDDYGVIEYVFDKKDICKKVTIYSQSSRKLVINSAKYNLITVKEPQRVTYIVTKKK